MNQADMIHIDSLCDQSLLMAYEDLSRASILAEESLELSEQLGYPKGIINSRIILCALEIFHGNLDLARDKMSQLEQDLVIQASPDECLMRLNHVRGLYFIRDGNYRDSFDAYTRCGVLAARLGKTLYQGFSDNGKGCVKLDQHEFEDADKYFKDAGRNFQSSENKIVQALVSLNEGCVFRGLGKIEQAETLLKDTLELTVQKGWKIIECSVLDELGSMMLEEGKFDQAEAYIDEGIEKSGRMGYQNTYMNLVYEKARLLIQKGQLDRAEQLLQESSSKGQNDRYRPVYYQLFAEIQELQGDYRGALANYKTMHEVLNKIRGDQVFYSILKQENKILLPLKAVKIHIDDADSLFAWSVRNRKEILIRDGVNDFHDYVSKIKSFGELQDGEFFHSLICIPLWYINDVVGVISVQSLQKNAYSNSDLENLRVLGTYAGIAIRNALQTGKMNELNETLKRQSATDSLTGLANRREMVRQAKNIWRVCQRNKFYFTIIMIDLDHFKEVNDDHGHTVGDEVLKKFSSILNRFFKRALDCACRYGGEELMVVSGDINPLEAAARVELLREDLSSIEFSGKDNTSFSVQFSCGIYGEIPSEDSGKRLPRITSIVDAYLYEAKNNGRNCTYLSDDEKKPAEKFIPPFNRS
ncbi:MAG: hypothetical protein B6241_08840 [Spirochaetaceae bacterium 4572_59]|nr:MAG: hypothetical protein B6241_08840 [Spirochaetaceae bacterium 4572_59]